jgi:rhomboid protease GluP
MSQEPLWEQVARALGLSPTQLKWRWRRWRQQAQSEVRSVENRTRWMRYEHKTCPRCGHVADKDAAACPSCQAVLHGRNAQLALRLLDHLVPQGGNSVTHIALLFCVVIYAVMLQQDGFEHMWGFSTGVLMRFGALWPARHQEWWRLVTFNFSHVHVLHIGMNMWGLLDLGPLLEEAYGRARLVVLIVLTGVVAGLTSVVWYTWRYGLLSPPTAGASGWIFGLLGAAFVYAWRVGRSGQDMRAQMGRWAVYGLIYGFVISANNAAHVGGLVAGGLLALIMGTRRADELNRWERRLWSVLALLCIALVVAAFVMCARSPLPAALQRAL